MAIGSTSISATPIASSGTEIHSAFSSTLVSNIRPFVSGCPDFVIEQWARYAYIEFCRQTRRIRKDFTATVATTDPNTSDNDKITIDTSTVISGHKPVMVNSLFIDTTLYSVAFRELLSDATYLSENVLPSLTKFYAFSSETTIDLYPFSGMEDSVELYITAEFQPGNTVDEIPADIYDNWHETIESGALARLMRMPNREWTNRQESEWYRMDFWRGITDARIQQSIKEGRRQVQMRPLA